MLVLRALENLEARFLDGMTKELEEVCDEKNQIVLDLGNVDFVDSRGLELLVRIDQKLKAKEGRLILAGLKRFTREILSVTKLDEVITVCDSLDEALESGSG